MKWSQFGIRDLVWATISVAIALAWFTDAWYCGYGTKNGADSQIWVPKTASTREVKLPLVPQWWPISEIGDS